MIVTISEYSYYTYTNCDYLYRLLNYVVSLYIAFVICGTKTLIAIKAPHGNSVEVPHPDDEVRSQ
jgi:hypothetical protein